MISIVNYLMEGKVLEHIKRNRGKYLLGAAATQAALLVAAGNELDKHINPETPDYGAIHRALQERKQVM